MFAGNFGYTLQGNGSGNFSGPGRRFDLLILLASALYTFVLVRILVFLTHLVSPSILALFHDQCMRQGSLQSTSHLACNCNCLSDPAVRIADLVRCKSQLK